MNVNFNRHMCPQETVQVWRRKEIRKWEIITQGTQCYGVGGGRSSTMCYQMPLTQLPDALTFSGSGNRKNKVRYKALYLGWNFYRPWSVGSGMQPGQAPETLARTPREHDVILTGLKLGSAGSGEPLGRRGAWRLGIMVILVTANSGLTLVTANSWDV